MAYLLIGISALLIPFHWRADYQGDAYLAVGLPNQSVERTGMSRSGQSRFQRHWRLIPVAHLGRSAASGPPRDRELTRRFFNR